MDENKELNNSEHEEELHDEDYQLSHMDKLAGVFTEPASTFERMSKEGPKATDWLIPVLLAIIIGIAGYVVMMNNPQIKYQAVEKGLEQVQKSLDEAVEKGQITREQADQQLEATRQFMESGSTGMIIQAVSIFFITIIIFFVVVTVLYVFAGPILGGQGSYGGALSAYGLPNYVLIIHSIVIVVVSLSLGKMVTSISISTFAGMDNTTLVGFILHKLDPFTLWFWGLVGIGLAKLFKSENTVKYVLATYGLWFGFFIIIFFLSKQISFLENFLR